MAVGVSAQHTSVPRWSEEPPEVDDTGRWFLVVSVGDPGREVAARWRARIEALGRPIHIEDHAPGDPLAVAVSDRLADARVGTRIMVAAPELETLDALQAAQAAGAIDAEIRTYVTDRSTKRVQCVHCKTQTEAVVAIDETVTCAGCGRRLLVYHHVSPVLGAYMGFMADAEEPAE